MQMAALATWRHGCQATLMTRRLVRAACSANHCFCCQNLGGMVPCTSAGPFMTDPDTMATYAGAPITGHSAEHQATQVPCNGALAPSGITSWYELTSSRVRNSGPTRALQAYMAQVPQRQAPAAGQSRRSEIGHLPQCSEMCVTHQQRTVHSPGFTKGKLIVHPSHLRTVCGLKRNW